MEALQQLASSGALEALTAVSSAASGATGFVTARRNAERLEEAGRIAESESLVEGAKLMARQRVAYAAAGVDISAGTPLDVLAETAAQEQMNALRARYGYKVDAYSQRQAGTAALTGGLFQGATTVLTGAQRRAAEGAGGYASLLRNRPAPRVSGPTADAPASRLRYFGRIG